MIRRGLLVLVLLAFAVPFVSADSIIQLNFNNIGCPTACGSIGTVTLHQDGANVDVTLQANSGFGFKVGGGADILFNTNASLTAGSISNLLINNMFTADFGFSTDQTRAGFKFNYDITGLTGGGSNPLPNSLKNAQTISFVISGVTVNQLMMANGKNPFFWGVHFCVGSDPGCGTTGFAFGPKVPEPGTLALLGSGLAFLGTLVRRRFRT